MISAIGICTETCAAETLFRQREVCDLSREFSQTMTAITKGKRRMNIPLVLK